MAKKCILILLDGLGDRSCEALDDLTPLQAARTPALDRLAREGANGLYHAARLGQALPSENAHFSLFGYDLDAFPGRGALEALGAGIDLSTGTVAVLAHFVSATESPEGTLLLVDGKPDAPDEELQALFQAVEHFETQNTRIRLHPTHGFRGILTLVGPVAPFITDSDPIDKGRLLTAVLPWQGLCRRSTLGECGQCPWRLPEMDPSYTERPSAEPKTQRKRPPAAERACHPARRQAEK